MAVVKHIVKRFAVQSHEQDGNRAEVNSEKEQCSHL